MGRKRIPVEDRFWARVERGEDAACWIWRGAYFQKTGYGLLNIDGKPTGAHRIAWELLRGPIPDGAKIDHQCHNADPACRGSLSCLHRRCVNPSHLEPSSTRQNLLRGRTVAAANAAKTHCPAGHPYDDTNTYRSAGRRVCRTCSLARSASAHRTRHASEGKLPKSTHCRKGHPMTPENVYVRSAGVRRCRTCALVTNRASNARRGSTGTW